MRLLIQIYFWINTSFGGELLGPLDLLVTFSVIGPLHKEGFFVLQKAEF